MGFNFPASPLVGETYQPAGGPSYSWDGEKWRGGVQSSQVPTEQIFEMGGKTAQDILVPSWARSCELEGYANGMAARMFVMRYSLDGTNFLVGASDYGYQGPHHATGSNLYQTQAAASSSLMYLTYQGDNPSVPHHFIANIPLTRPDTSRTLGYFLSQATTMDTLAAYVGRTFWLSGYLGIAAAGSALRIAAIRVLASDGNAMPAGAWLRVKWFGDSGQLPLSNAMPVTPNDGNEYVAVNGVWRLKRQEFPWTANILDIQVPTSWNPKRATVNFFVGIGAAVLESVQMRGSIDGVNYPFGASDYYYSGVFGQGTAANFQPITAGTSCYLTFDADNISVGHQGTVEVELEKLANSVFTYRGIGTSYNNSASVNQRVSTMAGYMSGALITGATRLKALRFFLKGGSVPTGGSRMSVEWS